MFSNNGIDTQPIFRQITTTESNRQKFVNNLVDFMKKYSFDGVDIDWEWALIVPTLNSKSMTDPCIDTPELEIKGGCWMILQTMCC